MASPIAPKANILGIEIDDLQIPAVFALFHFLVCIIISIWNSTPHVPWSWWPTGTCQFDIPDAIGELLPSEKKNKTKTDFKTLATFRSDFDLRVALYEYHRNPILYAIALEKVGREVYWAAYQKDASRCRALLAKDHRNHQKFYMAGWPAKVTFIVMSWQDIFLIGQVMRLLDKASHVVKNCVLQLVGRATAMEDFATAPETSSTPSTVNWIEEFIRFRRNVRALCRNIGSEIEENTPLWDTIRNLKKYASKCIQKASPLYREIKILEHHLESQKRIIAALQVRCTIENLVNEIPDKGKYDDTPSAKWRKLWGDILENVNTNDQNPFCALLKDARGHRAEDIKKAGLELYSAMSAEIHGFEGWNVKYNHFDRSTRNIVRLLRPNQNRDVNWKEEIKKYPFNLGEDGASFKKVSRRARQEPSKEWIESTGFCEECLSNIAKKSSGRLGVKLDPVEDGPSTNALDTIDDKDDLGIAALMS